MKKSLILYILLIFNLSNLILAENKTCKNNTIDICDLDNLIESVIKPFYFESNSFIFCDQDYIEKFALLREEYPDISIKLTGHCTNDEFRENPLLSDLRVKHIAHLLNLMGIEKNKIMIEDLKNSQPIDATGNDPKNQRVTILLQEE